MEAINANTLSDISTRWGSLQEMLYDVMSDLHREWVREYLVRSDMQEDARVLSSPEKRAESYSSTCLAYHDPKYSSINMFSVDLSIPAIAVEDITVGVAVESFFGEGAPPFIVRRKDRFVHFVRNDYSGAILTLSFDEEAGMVEMSFYRQESLTRSLQLMVRFNSSVFVDAFMSWPGRIGVGKLEQGLLSVLIGDAIHDPKEPFLCDSATANCMSCGSETVAEHFTALGLPGDWYTNASMAWYDKSVVVFSVPLSTNFRRGPGVASIGIEEMIRWGMNDRLGRLTPIVKYVLSCRDEDLNLGHLGGQRRNADKRPHVPITPWPVNHIEKKEDSPADEIEKKRRDKVMRRNMRKREAAHRSNVKRKERTRMAEIALILFNLHLTVVLCSIVFAGLEEIILQYFNQVSELC